MAIGGDPKISLMFLYKNDSFYSLCLADLLTAPQQVKNRIVKEQKELATVRQPIFTAREFSPTVGSFKNSACHFNMKYQLYYVFILFVDQRSASRA